MTSNRKKLKKKKNNDPAVNQKSKKKKTNKNASNASKKKSKLNAKKSKSPAKSKKKKNNASANLKPSNARKRAKTNVQPKKNQKQKRKQTTTAQTSKSKKKTKPATINTKNASKSKKHKKNKNSAKSNARPRAQTVRPQSSSTRTPRASKRKSPKKVKTPKNTSHSGTKIKQNKKKTTSKTPKSNSNSNTNTNTNSNSNTSTSTSTTRRRFPWESWKAANEDGDDGDDDGEDEKEDFAATTWNSAKKKGRTNSMTSIADFRTETKRQRREQRAQAKVERAQANNFKYDEYRGREKREYKKKHRKRTPKIVPHHHVKRSSLPTYNSLRNNSRLLQKHLHKESNRDLASLMLDPSKRTKSKAYKNLTAGGFEVHVNKRYQLNDGRIGLCKFRGRTLFGKSSEDWIGIVVEVGAGEHDGTVAGKSYFKCREGKGVMVRPFKIATYLGSQNNLLSKADIKAAEKAIKQFKKRNQGQYMETDNPKANEMGYMEDHGDGSILSEKLATNQSILDKNKNKKVSKKARHFQV